MQQRLLYSGFDKVDVAFQGALPSSAIAALHLAREEARTNQAPSLISLGPGQVRMHVAEHGMRGGYAFVVNTGPIGENWFFKEGVRPSDWNLFASVHSKSLICASLPATFARLRETLASLGCIAGRESVNRIDFAMDFLAPGFDLDHTRFVSHRRTKVRPHWSLAGELNDQPSAVIAGRRCESVTVGRMPGRQVIVYDKRREAIDKRSDHWFKLWGIDPTDSRNEVWRVELRAGKSLLKDRWRLSSFQDVNDSIGDVFAEAMDEIRYHARGQTDSNVSRQMVDPLWQAARDEAVRATRSHSSGLLAGQILELDRQTVVARYRELLRGIAAGLSVAMKMNADTLADDLPDLVAHELRSAIGSSNQRFWRSRQRAEDRLNFILE